MSKGRKADIWYKMYAEKFLWGTIKAELEVEERAVWIDFLCLAATFKGRVDITYTKKLASMLIIPHELLERSIKKFEKTKRIKISRNKKESKTFAKILKWHLYQSEFLGGNEKKESKISDTLNGPRGTTRIQGTDKKRVEESRREERGEEKSKTGPPINMDKLAFEIQPDVVGYRLDIKKYEEHLEDKTLTEDEKKEIKKKLEKTKKRLEQLTEAITG